MKLGLNTISLWFGMIMVLIVTAGAFAFIFTDFYIDKISSPKQRYGFAAFFLAYAVYRGIRIYQTIRYKKEE
jgi:hypothetical protein